jgi:hypothetical protein
MFQSRLQINEPKTNTIPNIRPFLLPKINLCEPNAMPSISFAPKPEVLYYTTTVSYPTTAPTTMLSNTISNCPTLPILVNVYPSCAADPSMDMMYCN